MEAEKLFKKGEPAKAEDGSLVLVNENKEAYKVNEAVIVIWDMCNGISFADLFKKITEGAEQDTGELETSLEALLNELQEVKLLELK